MDTGENGVKYTSDQYKVLNELKELISEEVPSEEEVFQKLMKVSRVFIDHNDFSTKSPSPTTTTP